MFGELCAYYYYDYYYDYYYYYYLVWQTVNFSSTVMIFCRTSLHDWALRKLFEVSCAHNCRCSCSSLERWLLICFCLRAWLDSVADVAPFMRIIALEFARVTAAVHVRNTGRSKIMTLIYERSFLCVCILVILNIALWIVDWACVSFDVYCQ